MYLSNKDSETPIYLFKRKRNKEQGVRRSIFRYIPNLDSQKSDRELPKQEEYVEDDYLLCISNSQVKKQKGLNLSHALNAKRLSNREYQEPKTIKSRIQTERRYELLPKKVQLCEDFTQKQKKRISTDTNFNIDQQIKTSRKSYSNLYKYDRPEIQSYSPRKYRRKGDLSIMFDKNKSKSRKNIKQSLFVNPIIAPKIKNADITHSKNFDKHRLVWN